MARWTVRMIPVNRCYHQELEGEQDLQVFLTRTRLVSEINKYFIQHFRTIGGV